MSVQINDIKSGDTITIRHERTDSIIRTQVDSSWGGIVVNLVGDVDPLYLQAFLDFGWYISEHVRKLPEEPLNNGTIIHFANSIYSPVVRNGGLWEFVSNNYVDMKYTWTELLAHVEQHEFTILYHG